MYLWYFVSGKKYEGVGTCDVFVEMNDVLNEGYSD